MSLDNSMVTLYLYNKMSEIYNIGEGYEKED